MKVGILLASSFFPDLHLYGLSTDFSGQGFLTSPELFYVRNHGPVPHVRDEDILTWELSVEGSVPFSLPFLFFVSIK